MRKLIFTCHVILLVLLVGTFDSCHKELSYKDINILFDKSILNKGNPARLEQVLYNAKKKTN